MKSCIYEGQVRHRRFRPREHMFSYKLYMMFIDLDELPTLFDRFWFWSSRHFNLAWFKRSDHLGSVDVSLQESVRELIREETGVEAKGPIRLLTHCRYFGFGFNPVSFYYCYDERDKKVEHIVAEVNNTPWGEQYCYVLGGSGDDNDISDESSFLRYAPKKDFHVSPFMPMNIDYDWRFNQPGVALSVHMQNYVDDEKLFDATISMTQTEISTANMARVLLSYPLITLKVVVAIYFEAARLFFKRTPFYDHPGQTEKSLQRGKS